jgi:hypothetical protein
MNEPLLFLPGMMCGLIPGARFAVIPGGDHLPVLEQSELTNIEIKLGLNT